MITPRGDFILSRARTVKSPHFHIVVCYLNSIFFGSKASSTDNFAVVVSLTSASCINFYLIAVHSIPAVGKWRKSWGLGRVSKIPKALIFLCATSDWTTGWWYEVLWLVYARHPPDSKQRTDTIACRLTYIHVLVQDGKKKKMSSEKIFRTDIH